MEKYNRNLINLIKVFDKHPYMFMNFLNKNDAFSESFKKKLSKALIKNKPYFTDIDKMSDYFLHILDVQETTVKDRTSEWNNKLYLAITEQRFEDAAKLRDTMIKKKIKIII